MSPHARNPGISSTRRNKVDNSSVPAILGDDLVLEDDAILSHAVHETISQGMSENTRKYYHKRITKIIGHLKAHFPYFYEIGVVKKVLAANLAYYTKYHFGKTEDLIYTGLNVKFFIFFLSSSTQKLPNGKLKSHDDLRSKYPDAIGWGAKMADGRVVPVPIIL